MRSGTCFDFIPVPPDRASCVAVARDLETALSGRLPEVRFSGMQEALRNWESLAAEERGHLACALGWRRALFLEDGWLWEHLDGSASPPARAAFARWAAAQTDILKDLPGARAAAGAEADACIAHAERILTLDLSRPEKPGYWVHRGAVDWTPRDEGIDNEVVIAALRLYPMLALARAHRLTGRAAFLHAAVELLADLTWEIPGNLIRRVGLGGCSTHWGVDALDVAIRTNNLMSLYSVVRTAPELTDEAALLIWKLLWFCGARGLEFWHKACHNIVFYEPAALGELGFLFSSFREAARWREAAQRRLAGALRGALMSDGSNIEGALGYHAAYLLAPQRVVDAAARAGLPLLEAFEQTYVRKRRRALEFWARIATPGRTLPPLGDCWPRQIGPELGRYGVQFDSAFARGVAAVDDPSAWPEETSAYLPVQRYAVMRSGWSPDALWCGFALRGWHAGHDHYDRFHVELQAGATRLLLDSGCIDYGANRPRSQASRAHNTLVIDNRNHRPGAAVDIRWHTTEAFDWAEGLAPGDAGVLHRRAVCFLKPACFLVLDRVVFPDRQERRCDIYWHLPAEAAVRVQGRSARAEGPDRSLDLAFLADDRWAVVQETGFVATDYLSWVDAPVLRLTDCRSTSFNVVTRLRPLQPGVGEADSGDWRLEPALSVGCNAGDGEALPEGQAVACTLQQPDGCIRILWCEPGTGEKRLRSGATPTGGAGDWSTDGDLLIVRERRGAGPQVWARGASRVAQGEGEVAYEAL